MMMKKEKFHRFIASNADEQKKMKLAFVSIQFEKKIEFDCFFAYAQANERRHRFLFR